MKKFIILLFMTIIYTFSPAASSENSIIDISKKVKQSFISELTAHNPSQYYIYNGKTSSIHVYEEKHEKEECVLTKIRDFFEKESYSEYFEFYPYDIISYFYDIATDINRSLRN